MTLAGTTRVRWGIISTGHIASVFAHDLALLPEEAELVAVSSRTVAKAEKFAADLGASRAYGSAAELAADPEIDVVYVASVHNDHFASAKLCLEAGKGVLVEKPLTVTDDEAESLVALARANGAFLMEAVWTRANPIVRRAVEIVTGGELGAVRHVAASFGFAYAGGPNDRLLDPAQAGGAILDLGVYPVHGVNLFLGEPDGLDGFGTFAGTGVDAHAAALLSYQAADARPAATASILCSLEASLPTRLEVFCTRGSVLIDNFIWPAEAKIIRTEADAGEPELLITQWPGQGYTFEAQEVMRCVRAGLVESPLVPWADTLACMRTLSRWQVALAAAKQDRGSA